MIITNSHGQGQYIFDIHQVAYFVCSLHTLQKFIHIEETFEMLCTRFLGESEAQTEYLTSLITILVWNKRMEIILVSWDHLLLKLMCNISIITIQLKS